MMYGYCRVSTAEQVLGTSLGDQKKRVRGAALMRGADVDEVFNDAGVSGSKSLGQRPEGGRLLATLKPGDTVIAAKMDRVFRDAADALTMADYLKKKGVDLICADIGPDPVTANGVSKMFFGMLVCFAEFERSRLRERQADGIRAKKQSGGYIGGKCPFGYRIDGEGKAAVLIPIQAERDAIAVMKRLRKAGDSYRDIARNMQQQGFNLSHAGVQKILNRENG